MSESTSLTKDFHMVLKPEKAWMAILGLVFFSVLCLLVHAGDILRLTFPIGAFAVGLFLYFRYPILYLGFTWWMWFLTPWVRRLVDYQSGWVNPSPVLLAPYLVTLVTFTTFVQYLPKSYKQGGLPFVLACIGVFYGFLVGLIQNSPTGVAVGLLDWLVPVLFGFHLFVNWQDYPSYCQNIQRTFFWCVLVTGTYGVLQFLIAPEWDRLWIMNINDLATEAGAAPSFGQPEPLAIRVFSTMSGPGIFATVMMTGLLLLLNYKRTSLIPATVFGYLAFLLSVVRSAWMAWLVGLLTLVPSLKPRLQMRLILIMLITAACIFPLTALEPFSEVINSRFQSFSNLGSDGSGIERRLVYETLLNKALTNLTGEGIGANRDVVLDSGILDTLLSLGWFGTFFYACGMLLLLLALLQGSVNRLDSFASTTRAIALGIFFQLIFGSMMLELPGLVLWGFLGLNLAAQKYHQYQFTTGNKYHTKL